MKLRTIVTVCVAVLFAFSCSKDFDPVNPSGGGGTTTPVIDTTKTPGDTTKPPCDSVYASRRKLSRILVSGVVRHEFFYDGCGRLAKHISYFSPTIRSNESRWSYDSKGRVTRIDNESNVSNNSTREQMLLSYNELFYNSNNRLQETKTYRISGGVTVYASRSVPEYDANGRTISVATYDENNKASSKNTYQYNSKNNIVSHDFYQYSTGTAPYWHYEYEYDDKKNPYKDIWVLPYGANQNNITKHMATSYATVPASVTTTLILFKTYDVYAYPTLVNENGSDYTYEYK